MTYFPSVPSIFFCTRATIGNSRHRKVKHVCQTTNGSGLLSSFRDDLQREPFGIYECAYHFEFINFFLSTIQFLRSKPREPQHLRSAPSFGRRKATHRFPLRSRAQIDSFTFTLLKRRGQVDGVLQSNHTPAFGVVTPRKLAKRMKAEEDQFRRTIARSSAQRHLEAITMTLFYLHSNSRVAVTPKLASRRQRGIQEKADEIALSFSDLALSLCRWLCQVCFAGAFEFDSTSGRRKAQVPLRLWHSVLCAKREKENLSAFRQSKK